MMPESRPDFVMVGGQYNGKVHLWASKGVREVEFRAERDIDDTYKRYGHVFLSDTRYSITAEIKDMLHVVADSYPEAFRTMFDMWSPAGPEQIEPQKAIE